MVRRFVSLSVGALALLVVLGAPGQLHAQRFRGGFRPGFTPGFRPGFMPGFRPAFTPGFRGAFTPGFNRFGIRRFDRFGIRRFDRFEDRFERRFGRGPFVSPFSPGLGSVFFPPF
jgi:hypothetical protein